MGRNGVKSVTAIRTPLLARVPPSSSNLKLLIADSHHACTAGEFIPVTRIYSSPSWDQYLTIVCGDRAARTLLDGATGQRRALKAMVDSNGRRRCWESDLVDAGGKLLDGAAETALRDEDWVTESGGRRWHGISENR
ncbi:hypothetical protein PIB30_045606 [Stylosanthes scabra]|uniref:Uncharacterized protein n=1 Tax=Stylosanthes scabra TaxID=79078 RepID=A0ABU6SGD1_9FABA|nr:hypothetical protein [Stylosanthes scabra]